MFSSIKSPSYTQLCFQRIAQIVRAVPAIQCETHGCASPEYAIEIAEILCEYQFPQAALALKELAKAIDCHYTVSAIFDIVKVLETMELPVFRRRELQIQTILRQEELTSACVVGVLMLRANDRLQYGFLDCLRGDSQA